MNSGDLAAQRGVGADRFPEEPHRVLAQNAPHGDHSTPQSLYEFLSFCQQLSKKGSRWPNYSSVPKFRTTIARGEGR